MTKITITTEAVNAIAEEEIIRTHLRRAEKAIKRDRTKELIAEGIDAEIAKVMASVGL